MAAPHSQKQINKELSENENEHRRRGAAAGVVKRHQELAPWRHEELATWVGLVSVLEG